MARLDGRMAQLARGRHGVVTRQQLLAMGFGSNAVAGRSRRGVLRPIYPGVYAFGGAALTANGRRMAAVLACGHRAVISHRSAARLWGIFPYEPSTIDVSRPTRGRTKHRGIALHEARLLADEVDEVDGIPTTSIFRTVFDLAAISSKREVERAFHETEVRRLTDRVSLPQLLARHPGRRGATTIREILASKEPAGITENEFEELFVAFLDANGLPRPRFNATLFVRGRYLRPDCMWPEQRLIAELDGRAVHGTDSAFENDRRRDRGLVAEDWRSMRITWLQL